MKNQIMFEQKTHPYIDVGVEISYQKLFVTTAKLEDVKDSKPSFNNERMFANETDAGE